MPKAARAPKPPVEYRRHFTCATCLNGHEDDKEKPFAQMNLNQLKIHMANVHGITELKGRKTDAAHLDFAREYSNCRTWIFGAVAVYDVESGPRHRY